MNENKTEIIQSINNLLFEAEKDLETSKTFISKKRYSDAMIYIRSASETALNTITMLRNESVNEPSNVSINLGDLINEIPRNEPDLEPIIKLQNEAIVIDRLFQERENLTEQRKKEVLEALENSKKIVWESKRYFFTHKIHNYQ